MVEENREVPALRLAAALYVMQINLAFDGKILSEGQLINLTVAMLCGKEIPHCDVVDPQADLVRGSEWGEEKEKDLDRILKLLEERGL